MQNRMLDEPGVRSLCTGYCCMCVRPLVVAVWRRVWNGHAGQWYGCLRGHGMAREGHHTMSFGRGGGGAVRWAILEPKPSSPGR